MFLVAQVLFFRTVVRVCAAGTCLLDIVHDAAGHGAAVEDVSPSLGDPLVRVRQFWESDDVVFFQDVSLRVTKHFAGTGTQNKDRGAEENVPFDFLHKVNFKMHR